MPELNKIKYLVKKIFTISTNDSLEIRRLKEKFQHDKRSFTYGYRRMMADCLYCHASPGVLETTILELIKLKPAKDGVRLLNLGGGTGQVAEIFKFLGYEVFNLDLDVRPQDENDHNLKYDLNDVQALPFSEGSFDIVLCQEIIEHIENPWKLLRDAKSALKEGGLVIVSTPNVQSAWSRLNFFLTGYLPWFSPGCFDYHINPIFAWEIKLMSEKTGLKIEKIKGNGDYFFRKKESNPIKITRRNEELIYFLTLDKQG